MLWDFHESRSDVIAHIDTQSSGPREIFTLRVVGFWNQDWVVNKGDGLHLLLQHPGNLKIAHHKMSAAQFRLYFSYLSPPVPEVPVYSTRRIYR